MPSLETAKLMIMVLCFCGCWLAEQRYPFRHTRQQLAHDGRNCAFALLNMLIIGITLSSVLLAIGSWTMNAQFGLLNQLSLPWLLQLIIAIILIDCWQYCWHRLNHRVSWLWRFHKIHHVDSLMNSSSAFRFHFGEIILSTVLRCILIPIFGIPLLAIILYEIFSLPVIIFHHSNIRLSADLDKKLQQFIVTPGMHWIHHSNDAKYTDSNYASFLSIWDKLFASYNNRLPRGEVTLGLKSYPLTTWQGFWQSIWLPFR